MVLVHPPDVNVALSRRSVNEKLKERTRQAYQVVSGGKKRTVTSDTHTSHRNILHGHELMRAFALAQVPNSDISTSITTDQFSLVWMDDHIIYGMCMLVVALDLATSSIPDSHGHVFRTRNHPFPFTVESHTRHVVRMSLELHYRVGIAGLDVVKAHHVSARSGQVFLVWGDA